MNTERLAVLLLGFLLLACNKSEDGPSLPPTPNEGVDTRYTIVSSAGNMISASNLDANLLSIGESSGGLTTDDIPQAEQLFREGNSFSFLRSLSDCSAELSLWNTDQASHETKVVFADELDCDREVLTISHNASTIYIAFSLPGLGLKEKQYYIEALPRNNGSPGFGLVELQAEPKTILTSASKLFVLTYDIATDKYGLLVLDEASGTPVYDMDLGLEVLKVLKNSSGNILVSYALRHIIVNASTLEVITRVLYTEGKEPNFGNSVADYFDANGVLYYAMPTNMQNSDYEHIPGVYDFDKHTAYLYYYQNFLTEDRRALYNIGDTRSVSFDHHNGLILIGYQKSGAGERGGLLRIKPIPEPKLVDKTDLDGIPLYIAVK